VGAPGGRTHTGNAGKPSGNGSAISRAGQSEMVALPDDELHLGDKADDQLPFVPHLLQDGVPPLFHFRLALHEDRPTNAGGLRQSRVRNVAFVTVELAPREKPARRNKRLCAARLPLRICRRRHTRYEHKLWRTFGHDSVEGCQQSIDLALPPIKLSQGSATVGRVVCAQREWSDATVGLPFRQAREDHLPTRRLSGNAPQRSWQGAFIVIANSGSGTAARHCRCRWRATWLWTQP